MKRSVTFKYISLQTNLAHQFVNVSLLCKTFGGVIPVIPHVQ